VQKLNTTVYTIIERSINFLFCHPGKNSNSFDPTGFQLLYLIFHQRDKRCNNDTNALPGKRRYLKTDRLATTRWHKSKRITTIQNRLNDFVLQRAKRFVPPILT